MSTTLPRHMRAWQDELEIPDADPEPFDADAEVLCEACQLPTLFDTMQITPTGSLVCFSCYCKGFQLQPLPSEAA